MRCLDYMKITEILRLKEMCKEGELRACLFYNVLRGRV